ncbi:MAG: fumarylacetoacetate hydrolase family protein [Candidatus Omnitrophica bacterium]|nr:fumarylacetoacetate hydrolase family protein [Candidatus Omnitrophota bacterium]
MKIVRCFYVDTLYKGVLADDDITVWEENGRKRCFKLQDVTLLAPVVPSKIVSVGLNYSSHAEELGMSIPENPIIFIKPSTAVIGPYDAIIYPKIAQRVDYEAELALVIKKEARNVRARDSGEYIEGYTCFNDVTARDLQKKDVQWTRAKSFDTFAPIGPWIETEVDPGSVQVRAYVNGELKQDSNTREFIFKIPQLVEFISGIMTLLPGDVITTGTPSNVGSMVPGDKVVVEIEGIGKLENHVISMGEI